MTTDKTSRKRAVLHIPHRLRSGASYPSVVHNIVPCKISHDGPANVKDYFKKRRLAAEAPRPCAAAAVEDERRKEREEEELYESYFRGRKFVGRRIALREKGFQGLVLPPPPDAVSQQFSEFDEYTRPGDDIYDDDEEEDESEMEEKELEAEWTPTSAFQEMYIWGHDAAPDPKLNPWIVAVDEWARFAQSIHDGLEPASDIKQDSTV
ncbi:ribonuclease H2 non-catalytic subunit-domain-containing protein [Myxozyma melibiosi]|uniref:Ribonuclease H2 non-catalytic subunit-domain-containing protein n=1 Tax=Myxozyma melibiosi TaxID=54550 RepID=A0ABR1EXY7_9ASCO